MDKIASFTVDHNKLDCGIYTFRVDGDCYTFDLRMKKPNTGDVLATDAMHAIEHIGATWLRSSRFKDQIIYVGPMGCRTGFYLITRDLTGQPLVDLVIDAFRLLPDSIIAALNYLLPALFGAMCMQRIMMDYKSAFVLLPCALIIRYLSTLGVFKVLPFGGGYAPILSCVIIGVVVAKALHGKAAAKPKA
jgi:S-ribosylhomocysteine lyase LuxS involved in autoinducer biosynthesis